MKISNHLLLDDRENQVDFQKSPNQSSRISQLCLIIHYTAGLTIDSTVSWFLSPDAKASAHLVIGRDGRIVQMVVFNRRAWHAGKSKWGELEGLNQYSIGIELVNAGRLRKRADGNWVNWSGNVIPANEVTLAKHKNEDIETCWHEYTEAQINTAVKAASALNSAYEFADILGHEDISPGRKTDPGPLFPMSSFRSIVLGRA